MFAKCLVLSCPLLPFFHLSGQAHLSRLFLLFSNFKLGFLPIHKLFSLSGILTALPVKLLLDTKFALGAFSSRTLGTNLLLLDLLLASFFKCILSQLFLILVLHARLLHLALALVHFLLLLLSGDITLQSIDPVPQLHHVLLALLHRLLLAKHDGAVQLRRVNHRLIISVVWPTKALIILPIVLESAIVQVD